MNWATRYIRDVSFSARLPVPSSHRAAPLPFPPYTGYGTGCIEAYKGVLSRVACLAKSPSKPCVASAATRTRPSKLTSRPGRALRSGKTEDPTRCGGCTSRVAGAAVSKAAGRRYIGCLGGGGEIARNDGETLTVGTNLGARVAQTRRRQYS